MCGEELQLDGRQVDAKKSTKNLSQKETLARPIRPRPFGREMSLRRFARGGLPVPVTTEFVISALTIIVPGCLTVCPSRTVRLTYRGGDCTMLPRLGRARVAELFGKSRAPTHGVRRPHGSVSFPLQVPSPRPCLSRAETAARSTSFRKNAPEPTERDTATRGRDRGRHCGRRARQV